MSREGHFVTNHHVIDECSRPAVVLPDGHVALKLIAVSEKDDLALLRLIGAQAPAVARFRADSRVMQAESVMVAGFPLQDLLAAQFSTTTGAVSARSGIGGDKRMFSFTAPIQSGNSGGPVLDANGLVVGVVRSRVRPEYREGLRDESAQLVNFAVKGVLVQSLLEIEGVEFLAADAQAELSGWVGAARDAAEYVYRIECW